MERVGITTTLPVETLLAAGLAPVDLNNIFITSTDAPERIERAEHAGFPRSVCAWVKGIYTTVVEEGIRTVVGVMQGDCSLTHALLEILSTEGVEVIPFEFPHSRDIGELDRQIARLERAVGVERADTTAMRERLAPTRRTLGEIDRVMSDPRERGLAERLHLALLTSSDFAGDVEAFDRSARALLNEACAAPAPEGRGIVRLALAGIPPIVSDLFQRVEDYGARIVLSEMPREFAMVRTAETLLDQYAMYTYPYDTFHRLRELARETSARAVEGVIHYVQSFCFRGVQDRLLRRGLDVPVLTLECDRPGRLDARSVTRLEAFVEMLAARRKP